MLSATLGYFNCLHIFGTGGDTFICLSVVLGRFAYFNLLQKIFSLCVNKRTVMFTSIGTNHGNQISSIMLTIHNVEVTASFVLTLMVRLPL